MIKKTLLQIILIILIIACSVKEDTSKSNTKYFDINNQRINPANLYKKYTFNQILDIPGDSLNHRRLVIRENHGQINDRPLLQSVLEEITKQELDSSKPIVIIYYPGKDPCNSSGTGTKESIYSWYKTLEKRLNKIAQIKPIYIYKDSEGLERYDGFIKWQKDPAGIIEKLFFKYHYPCSSFVVVSKSGNYISFYGEFSQEYVWDATKFMNE